ncbi:Mor transcription activator family protein [Aeromonas jandaei]|uniref:Mor transcription activator family protein n=1 Tax=Aeromonas jandaei TaxID=650 RepID=UPI003BA3032B
MKDETDLSTVDLFGVGVDLNAIDPETYRMLSDDTAPGWSEQLRAMFDVISHVVENHRDDKALDLLIISEICRNFGGAPFYVPNGSTLKTVIRSIQIWKEFDGKNQIELSRKHGVTLRSIQFILSSMRKSHLRKIQGDMFVELGHDPYVKTHPNGRPCK